MAPRLKVFVTSDGLTDYVVATTSKAKALAAWGVRQDLFREGLAHEVDDEGLAAAAKAKPDEVLRRPAGARGELARLKSARPSARPKGPSKAALRKVADLEARLAALDTTHEKALAGFDRRRAELEREAEAEAADHAARRGALQQALSAARRALGPPPADSGRS